jgi:hypothetical protein
MVSQAMQVQSPCYARRARHFCAALAISAGLGFGWFISSRDLSALGADLARRFVGAPEPPQETALPSILDEDTAHADGLSADRRSRTSAH